MSAVHINKQNFQEEVIQSDKPVLLDFWAPWCGPCRMVGPILDEIARERSDIKVAKINVDEESELAMQFRVMSIPTLVVMKNGQVVSQSAGARPKSQILAMLKKGGSTMILLRFLSGPDINREIVQFQNTPGAVLLDVLTAQEHRGGYIPESVNLPLQSLGAAEHVIRDKSTPVFVYCQSGFRSKQAVRQMLNMGYRSVVDLGGLSDYHGVLDR